MPLVSEVGEPVGTIIVVLGPDVSPAPVDDEVVGSALGADVVLVEVEG